MLQMLTEDTEKHALIGVGHVVILSCLLTSSDGILLVCVHILYVICGWKSRGCWKRVFCRYQKSSSLCKYFPCLCTPYITRTAVSSLSPSVYARCMQLRDVNSVNGFLRQSTEHPTFRVNVSFSYEPSFPRTGISRIHSVHMWSHGNAHTIHVTISNDSFP
jgi:hypothetical protein